MSQNWNKHLDPMLGEEVWCTHTSKGLPLRVASTDRFREMAAVVSFDYGSVDLGFLVDGKEHCSPEGVAHYLEHKLFEDEELKAFERFGRRGAQVNAMTSFAQTTYYFSATDQLAENLQDLLHLVSHAHLTKENVDKERGIIAQEIRMYEDSPDYRGFFDLLGCFYRQHPVRHPVGGTVESIQAIDKAELLACYHAFYHTGNAGMSVVGPVDRQEVLALAEACDLPQAKAPQRLGEADLGPVLQSRIDRKMQVARPRVLLGCKDQSLCADVEQRHRRDLCTRILLDSLFSAASSVRENLHQKNLVDDTLSYHYMAEHNFGVTVVGCETDDPDRSIQILRDVLFAEPAVTEEHLERVRRKFLGQYVRSFAAVKSMAMGHAKEALEDSPPFQSLQRMMSVTTKEIAERHGEIMREDAFAAAVVQSN